MASETSFSRASTRARRSPSWSRRHEAATRSTVRGEAKSALVNLGFSDRWDLGPSLGSMHGWQDFEGFNAWLQEQGRRVDLAGLRVAITPDFGFAPTERHIREVFAEKTGFFRHVFARTEDATPDCSGADEAFEVLRGLNFLASHLERVRSRPQDVGPNVRANVEEALRYTAEDIARAEVMQTTMYRRWQDFFEGVDVILTPSITCSPRPWSELYPTEIDGEPTRTYFQWLALAYAVTLVGHPAVSLPVGLDRNGMPFGLQVVGPRGGDAFVLSVAAELEALLAGDPRTARPVPDLAKLRAAAPISAMPGFLGFG